MSEIVFILGAGASKEAGAPLMADFLDKADQLRKEGQVDPFKADFDKVLAARSQLQAVHSKSELNLDNLESVFAAFEMGRLLKRLPGVPQKDIASLSVAIRRLIFVTLEKTVAYRTKGEAIYPDEAYRSFALLVSELNSEGTKKRCSIMTFNYDLALDFALWSVGVPVDYGLEESTPGGSTVLLKLHGSLNWIRCSKCRKIVPWGIGSFMNEKRPYSLKGHQFAYLNLASRLSSSGLKHCGQTVRSDPVIVPPTWNKTEYHQSLSGIWRRAASELFDAENIFVSGYSLTETDSFFRYLFALGSVGKTLIKRFWVFDPDQEDVEPRFHKLVGPATKAHFKFYPKTFAEAVTAIRSEVLGKSRNGGIWKG